MSDGHSIYALAGTGEGAAPVVAFEGKLYAIGGRSGPSDFGFVDIYDPATNQWSAGPAIDPRFDRQRDCGTVSHSVLIAN